MSLIHVCRDRRAAVVAGLVLLVGHALSLPASAAGTSTLPVCAPADLVILDATSIDALTEVTEEDVTQEITLLFVPPPPQLVGLTANTRILITPTALLPSGFQGSVNTVDTSVPGTLEITASPGRRPAAQVAAPLALEFFAQPGAATRSCLAVESGLDTDGDGFGNLCDADLNNDCIVNAVDLGLFRAVFFTSDPDADFDGDIVVNATDLGRLKLGFFNAPGPSGATSSCGGGR